jgi:hypothetical protein
MTLETIAEQYRAKIKTDECGDKIIAGKRGQVYVDDDNVCLMRLDVPVIKRGRFAALGGKVWTGDISLDAHGKRVQDVRVQGIDETRIGDALRLAGVPVRRRLSPAHRAALLAGGQASRFSPRHGSSRPSPSAESPADALEVSQVPRLFRGNILLREMCSSQDVAKVGK